MPGPQLVTRDPTPEWLKPENASVFDSYWVKLARKAAGLIGANDPESQVMGIAGALEAPTVKGLVGLKALATGEKAAALDMSRTARMARAAEQGYGQALYHETDAANVRGLLDEGFDLNRVGARGNDEVMPNGVFLKPTEQRINVVRDPLQLPLRYRARNLKTFETRDDLERFLLRDPDYAKVHASLQANEHRYMTEWDAVEKTAWRPDGSEVPEAHARLDDILAKWKATNREIAGRARERATQLLRDTGAEGIHVKQDPGSFGRTVETTVIFDPRHVRYEDAAFDPSKLGSKGLLTSILGGVGLSQLAQQGQPPPEPQ